MLILESTYGGRLHANRHAEERRLVETVAEVTAAGGKVLIPAFALGRAQEILLTLGEFQRRGELAAVPVWADGMVRAICQAYSSFPEALPLALQEQGATFFSEQIRPVTGAAQRNALIWEPGPAVIVASSGMLAGGPSLAYARALAGQPQHAILLTGYQDEESPGRRLQEMAQRGRGTLRLGKDKIDVQGRLGTYSLSAHADTGQLVSLVETLDPAQVFLVHGDEDARDSLAAALRARGRNVRLPRAGQAFGFNFTPAARAASDLGRARAQVELAARRRAEIAAHGDLHGRWLLARDPEGEVRVAQVVAVAADHVEVQAEGQPATELGDCRQRTIALCGLARGHAEHSRPCARRRGRAGPHGRCTGRGRRPGADGAEPGAGHGQCPLSPRSALAPLPAIGSPNTSSP